MDSMAVNVLRNGITKLWKLDDPSRCHGETLAFYNARSSRRSFFVDKRKYRTICAGAQRPKVIRTAPPANGGPVLREADMRKGIPAAPLLVLESGDSEIIQRPLHTGGSALQNFFREISEGFGMMLRDPNPLATLGNILAKEAKIVSLFMCNDLVAGFTPYPCIGINMLAISPFLQTGDYDSFWPQVAATLGKEILFGFLYLYSFNLCNQYMGAPGDVIDKPWRPIPSGLLTRESALARCILVNSLYTYVSWQLGVLPWALTWQLVCLKQFTGLETDGKWGLGRNMAMWIGTSVMCGAGVQLAMPGPLSPAVIYWVLVRGMMCGNHHWSQDFRDVEGDIKVGRTTIPIHVGVEKARKLMAAIFLADPIFMHFVVLKDSYYTPAQLVCEAIVSVIAIGAAIRTLNFRTAEEDHFTYHWWLGAHLNLSLLLLSPACILSSTVL